MSSKSMTTNFVCSFFSFLLLCFLTFAVPVLAEDSEYNTLTKQAHELREKGEYKEALPIFQRAAEVAHELKKLEAEADATSDAAVCYGGMKEYEKQLELLKRAAGLARKAKSNSAMSAIYNSLADYYSAKSDFSNAIKNASKALSVGKQLFEADSVDLAVYKCTLAEAYIAAGKVKNAESLVDEGKKVFEKNMPNCARELAEALTDLGNIYCGQKRFDESERSFKAALDVFDKNFPQGNRRKAKTLQSFAKMLRLAGREAEAKKAEDVAAGINS